MSAEKVTAFWSQQSEAWIFERNGEELTKTDEPFIRRLSHCLSWHDTLLHNLQVCRDLLQDLSVVTGCKADALEFLERVDKCLKEAK